MKTLKHIVTTNITGLLLTLTETDDCGSAAYIARVIDPDFAIYDDIDELYIDILSQNYNLTSFVNGKYGNFVELRKDVGRADSAQIALPMTWEAICQRAEVANVDYTYYMLSRWFIRAPRNVSVLWRDITDNKRTKIVCIWRAVNELLCGDIAALIIRALLEMLRTDITWYTTIE